ncbi:hypothetical protein P280DRAFT_100808 [Massarina eburnea CBS 473.64]|uniref:Uncharacterized protein n=1 Tax=Massarina eburnea CBS 473.64 TaxID=1395130 RepID=A0A6A6RTK5_9PLEO|nr:hypothetical protein P280DRAFT_100808 [Massarina eburnea CBS 473.64]
MSKQHSQASPHSQQQHSVARLHFMNIHAPSSLPSRHPPAAVLVDSSSTTSKSALHRVAQTKHRNYLLLRRRILALWRPILAFGRTVLALRRTVLSLRRAVLARRWTVLALGLAFVVALRGHGES